MQRHGTHTQIFRCCYYCYTSNIHAKKAKTATRRYVCKKKPTQRSKQSKQAGELIIVCLIECRLINWPPYVCAWKNILSCLHFCLFTYAKKKYSIFVIMLMPWCCHTSSPNVNDALLEKLGKRYLSVSDDAASVFVLLLLQEDTNEC